MLTGLKSTSRYGKLSLLLIANVLWVTANHSLLEFQKANIISSLPFKG
jgi:hypothetical protein